MQGGRASQDVSWAEGSLDIASRSFSMEAPASLTRPFPSTLGGPVPSTFAGTLVSISVSIFSDFCMHVFLTHSSDQGLSKVWTGTFTPVWTRQQQSLRGTVVAGRYQALGGNVGVAIVLLPHKARWWYGTGGSGTSELPCCLSMYRCQDGKPQVLHAPWLLWDQPLVRLF
jgi:hypothetical protein